MAEWSAEEEAGAAQALELAGVDLRRGKSGKVRVAVITEACDVETLPWSEFLKLSFLVRVDAAQSQVGDQHVATLLQLPRLAQLDLSGASSVTDISCERFPEAKELQLLKLTGANVSGAAVRGIRKVMLKTRIVFL